MKQITILSGRCLVIELPEGAHSPVVTTSRRIGYYDSDISKYANLPPGNWRIIGMLSEVREECVKKVVEKTNEFGITMYTDGKFTFATALESLESEILAEGWYFENPYGETKPVSFEQDAMEGQLWESAQSRVLDRSRCLLLGRSN